MGFNSGFKGLISTHNYRPFSTFFLAYTRSWGCFNLHF